MPQGNQKQQAPQPSRQSSRKQQYLTAGEAGIYTPGIAKHPDTPMFVRGTNPVRYNVDMGRETRTVAGNIARGEKNPDPRFRVEPNYGDGGVIPKDTVNALRGHFTDQKVVAGRDAYNAKLMRGELANRASAAANRSALAASRRAALGKGLMRAGGLAATAFLAGRDAEHGEPNNNDYGTSALGGSNGSYPNQGKMSKALGVKNTKAGM